MNSSGYWDQSSINHSYDHNNQELNHQRPQNPDFLESGEPEFRIQNAIPHDEILASINSSLVGHEAVQFVEDEEDEDEEERHQPPETGFSSEDESNNWNNDNVNDSEQQSPEVIQQIYYQKGIEELESLQLLDLSPLANWKLSSFKQGFGLSQLREDSPDSYWQSDGSNGSNANNSSSLPTSQLSNPHSITIQFSKKVSLERISIFTNFQLDESYTPSKIKIMAGSSDGWDLSEVCTVNFNKPMGWSHIIFNGIRGDGVLKCFMVKIIILANHQDGKDSHIRDIRCFGKKSNQTDKMKIMNLNKPSFQPDFLNDLSLNSGFSNLSGFSLNNRQVTGVSDKLEDTFIAKNQQLHGNNSQSHNDNEVSKVINNIEEVIGFNTGFQSIELRSTSNIR